MLLQKALHRVTLIAHFELYMSLADAEAAGPVVLTCAAGVLRCQ